MRTIHVDLETAASVSISDCGVFKYVESPDFRILLIGYAFDDDPVTVLDLTGMSADEIERWKWQFDEWVFDPSILKMAFNSSFEMTCFSKWLGRPVDISQWDDAMIWAAQVGLPRSLKDVGEALRLPEDEKKLKEGKALVRYFCTPCAPTKANGGRTWNRPEDAPEKWTKFIEYNGQDVEAERAIAKRIQKFKPSYEEHDAWILDQEINRRGVLCDRSLAEAAVKMSNDHTAVLMQEIKGITGLENPNSVVQLKQWFGTTEPLDKKAVARMLPEETGDRRRVLEIRKELGKSSVRKYQAMINYMCHDDRCRGLFQFYGGHTGRFSGRGVQLQNLSKNYMEDLDDARNLVKTGDRDSVDMLYGSVQDTLSQLVRTAFIPKPGYRFAVADFSAIEARVIAWVAGEGWRMKTFAEGGDIYCASASQMFHVPVVKHGVNGHLRQKGKIAELALGYGGGVGAMTNMGALDMGIPEEELPDIVTKWREASPKIVELWSDIGNAAMNAIRYGERIKVHHGIEFWKTAKLLHMRLPSGRCMRYFNPKIGTNRFGSESIQYESYDLGKWGTAETWGGKIVENAIQAIARDCLIVSMERVAERYPDIVMHVHDEMIVEVPKDQDEEALAYMEEQMGRSIDWAPGLILRGDGYLGDYYFKD